MNGNSASGRPLWVPSFFALREQMKQWIDDALRRHADTPYAGGHDEGSFIASWFAHYDLFGDERIVDFARFLRDGFAEWSREHYLHGFPRTGEAHHQTEIYNCFLARLWAVSPDDKTAELLVDAAHHIGNWVEGFPPWYDWDHHRFLSWHIGTETVGSGSEAGYEVPDHFRLIQLALVAYRITGEQRYLDLSCGYADRWSQEILGAPVERPPLVIVSGDTTATRDEMHRAAGGAHNREGGLDLIEPHVAAGTIDVLLDLYETTGAEHYGNAARRLCEALLPALRDPLSNPPAALINRYRLVTGDSSLDDALGEVLERLATSPTGKPVMLIDTLGGEAVAGIGKRRDMVRWAYRTPERGIALETSPPPSTLMLAYELTGDDRAAAAALDLIAVRMALARSALRDGRRHGCAGSTISAVASGHGRDGGYGNVTGGFYALACGALRYFAQERPLVRYRTPHGGDGLPEQIATLLRAPLGEACTLVMYNDGQEPLTVEVAMREGPWRHVTMQPGAIEQVRLE